jgi:hypothetical protein
VRPARALAVVAAFTSMAAVFVVKTFADTVFLAEYGVDYVPHFFVAQSALVVAISFGYSWAIRRGAIAIDIAILVGLAGISAAAPVLAELATFALALGMVTLSTLSQLAIWNAATAVVSGRKARAFLPRLGAAATAGAVAGGFASSALVGLAGIELLAWVSAGLAAATLGLRLALQRRAPEGRPRTRHRSGDPGRESARRLVALLAALVVVEALLATFVDFGFKREVAEAYATADAIGMVFALYYGVTNVALLVTQLAVASRLLATRSLRATLSLEPLAIGAIAMVWTVFPVLAIGALARGTEGVMKFAIARPAQEVAMGPLAESTRRRLKVILRGVLAPAGAALGGGLLIAFAPLLELGVMVVPATCVALAIALAVLARATARHYLAAMGSELGLRRMTRTDAEADAVLDRDALARVLELAGSDDRGAAELGRDLLAKLVPSTAVLARHVGAGNASTRRAVYDLLAERPSRACGEALRAAVAREPDTGGALDAGLLALAAHQDPAELDRARRLADLGHDTALDPARRATWIYLSRVGGLDGDPLHPRVLATLLASDGASAAAACDAAIARGAITGATVDELIAELVSPAVDREAAGPTPPASGPPSTIVPFRPGPAGEHATTRHQALVAAAALGHGASLALVISELAAGSRWPEEIAAQLSGAALARVCARVLDDTHPPRRRQRVLAALRGSDQPEVTELALAVLARPVGTSHELLALRDEAVRILRTRHSDAELPAEPIDRAFGEHLDRFAIYLRARPGYATTTLHESQIEIRFRGGNVDLSAEAFFLDELERCTEKELGRLCALLAVLGAPDAVLDAERGLRAPTFVRRRQALDVLQEIVHARHKPRLLELLERYLMPPRASAPEGRAAVLELDPWLARCARADSDPGARRLWALRSAPLFDAVDGLSLARLADRAEEIELARDTVVVREGDPGDALYVVIQGALAVERDGQTLAELGPGEAFGELALLDGAPRHASVRARVRSRVLELPRAAFDHALVAHPEIGIGLLLGLVKWLRRGKPHPRLSLRGLSVVPSYRSRSSSS